jgi:FKBP-type peptidyl-prolyl cis-trans isomerase
MRHVLPLLAAMSLAFAPVPPYRPKPSSERRTETLPSGLKYQDLKVGTGAPAKKGDTVLVHYTAWLAKDKKTFDSSAGRQAFQFELGAGKVIKGWDEGVAGMKPGGKRKLMIPAELAYGAAGVGPVIPPHADLIFEVEVLPP